MSQTKAQLIDPTDGSIVNADINASAAIAGSKISPDFGSQNIATTGTLGSGNLTITSSVPVLSFVDTDDNSDFRFKLNGGTLQLEDTTNSNVDRLRIESSGNVGIGTTSAGGKLAILSNSSSYEGLELQTPSGDGSGEFHIGVHESGSTGGRAIIFRRGGSDGMDTQTLKLSSDGKFQMGNDGSLDMGFGPQVMSVRGGSTGGYAGNSAAIFGQTDNNASVSIIYASASDYAAIMTNMRAARTNNSAYSFMLMSSSSGADNEFRFRGDGNGFADGSFSGGGADYAEYFEWSDGNSSDEDRRGYTVVLDGNKIRKSTSSDAAATIIGVVSDNPSIIGDGDLDKWKQKYKKDDYGSYLRDSNGERILNPDWDESLEYVSREKRKEWSTIGLIGKIRIRKGQIMGTNWIKMQDISDTVEEWLVK
tara:strand:- start:47 stop:1309 length:1263 start_codon:yes stop_codon:yes gene_type:complete